MGYGLRSGLESLDHHAHCWGCGFPGGRIPPNRKDWGTAE